MNGPLSQHRALQDRRHLEEASRHLEAARTRTGRPPRALSVQPPVPITPAARAIDEEAVTVALTRPAAAWRELREALGSIGIERHPRRPSGTPSMRDPAKQDARTATFATLTAFAARLDIELRAGADSVAVAMSAADWRTLAVHLVRGADGLQSGHWLWLFEPAHQRRPAHVLLAWHEAIASALPAPSPTRIP